MFQCVTIGVVEYFLFIGNCCLLSEFQCVAELYVLVTHGEQLGSILGGGSVSSSISRFSYSVLSIFVPGSSCISG